MPTKKLQVANIIEPTSNLWHKLFVENQVPTNGVIVEVAPGYEPKIGNALALLGFRGTIYLIEPDQKAAYAIQKIYKSILPRATIRVVIKTLENIEVGVDAPAVIDALVASHPFDDMVISSIVGQTSFFSQEKEGGAILSSSLKNIYEKIRDEDYTMGISSTVAAWKNFIEGVKPDYFIASQYPSHTLTIKGLTKRQDSGYTVLNRLKSFYKNSLVRQKQKHSFGYKGDPKWWIVAKEPGGSLEHSFMQEPLAIKRLGRSIFAPQKARQLRPDEYDIVYIDKKYFGNLEESAVIKQIRNLAIVLDNESLPSPETIIMYADRQKDKTGIGLKGNFGSGRAVYYGDRYNILGVGKTTLCKSTTPSHSTGKLEIIGAMRRVVLSRWINCFTHRAPAHPVLIALKETTKVKWNSNPVSLSLLVRIDDGNLDRPSHVEQSPQIPINFEKTLSEYAKLDAEYFAFRILLGAWSTSNYSLDGHMVDLESASFVKYRGPYYTSSAKYPENRFGYEGLGFLKILHQLARVKSIKDKEIEKKFYRERRKHLGYCFLLLLGIDESLAFVFFSKHQDRVVKLSDQFEKLAKKISVSTTNLNLYTPIADEKDPSLLDMSNFFRNLAKLYGSPNARRVAFEYLLRKHDQTGHFLNETKRFLRAVFGMLILLDQEKCLDKEEHWKHRLGVMNQSLPTMFELNQALKSLAESYRLGKISPKTLGAELDKLCRLPFKVLSKS